MEPDVLKIEIEHLSGQLMIEINIEVSATKIATSARGSNITWQADGVTITMPAKALDAIREVVKRLQDEQHAPASDGARDS